MVDALALPFELALEEFDKVLNSEVARRASEALVERGLWRSRGEVKADDRELEVCRKGGFGVEVAGLDSDWFNNDAFRLSFSAGLAGVSMGVLGLDSFAFWEEVVAFIAEFEGDDGGDPSSSAATASRVHCSIDSIGCLNYMYKLK